MPAFPTDLKKHRAFTDKQKAELAAKKKRHVAFQQAAKEAAQQLGLDPERTTIILCKRGKR